MAAPAPVERPARIASLDVVRGWMLVANAFVTSLFLQPEWFGHAAWDGVHPVDLVFPVFVTLSGCGLAFALARRVRLWPLARRVVVLLVVGLGYNAIELNSFDLATWWVTGVLQTYAGVIALVGLLHLVTRSWWGWAIITGAFTVAHSLLLSVWSSGCPDRALTPECNPSGVIDVFLLTAPHVYHQGQSGHDPVGVVVLLGAMISASAGVTVGHLLLAARRRSPSVRAAVLPLGVAALAFVALAQLTIWLPQLLGDIQPLVMKRLWTPPFALRIAAGTTIALLLAHLVVDRRRVGAFVRVTSWPLTALGRNSLLVFFGSHILMSILTRPSPSGSSVARDLAESIAIGGHVQLTWTIASIAFWVLVSSILHRFRLYLRV